VDLRELKALEIAARSKFTFSGGSCTVPSQSGNGSYRVTLGDEATCECDDFVLRRQPCKHILAARIVCARDHGGNPTSVAVDQVPKRPTYRQNWSLYNEAQQTEKHRFQELLFDLCRGVVEPARAGVRGQKPHCQRDMIFTMALKVYTGFSGRRAHTDLASAFRAGHLSKQIPGVKVSAFFENPDLRGVLADLITRSSLPLRTVETKFAPDSTGFSASRFVRWFDEKYGERSGRDWVKAHAICGVKTNIITHVEIGHRDAGDCPFFKSLVQATAKNFRIEEVSADKAYLSHENLALVDGLGGTAYVPFKCNSHPGEPGSLWNKMYGYYQYRREEFLKHYHLRSNAESTFSMLKAKMGDGVRSKTAVAMVNEALVKVLCHNLVVVHQSHIELGIEPVFWADGPVPEEGTGRKILPFALPG
jgi:transposase